MRISSSLTTFVIYMLLAGIIMAQEKKQSADEIARELSNPVGSLASMVFQGTWNHWGGSVPGADDQSSGALLFLPTLPFKAWGGNLVFRPSFSVAGSPTINNEGDWKKITALAILFLWLLGGKWRNQEFCGA